MKFNSLDDFKSWLNETTYSMSDLEISTTCLECTEDSSDSQTIVKETKVQEINIKSFSDIPKVKFNFLAESENKEEHPSIWFVDDYESMEGMCSTSKIVYKGDTLLMNVCEANGQSYVNLIVEVDGRIKHHPFILEKSCNKDNDYDIIFSL